ncbi:Hpt domain-containing protein [Desulfovibrio gilichinskyi]|uniref:Hpt domain-containing protein n=1 Tax=Desulfovibrio gilichinskyi TaxID=1519643 RepID=A0A1X7C2S5_9BACT|nr:Hpt domain-containing protein [Desulfovibrio gilichinskyi]SME88948.1 Hpt domain-containing protein [Desulfovibrio gilichinskyi]
MSCDQLLIAREFLSKELNLQSENLDDFMKEIVDSLHLQLDSLDEAIDDGDFESIIVHAHTLKESLGNLGLIEMSMLADCIEKDAKGTAPVYLGCHFMWLRKELLCLFQNGLY